MNICALSTGKGGAIAIIRTSGPDVISIVNRLFSKDISQAKGQTLHYGAFLSAECRVQGAECRVQGAECRVQSAEAAVVVDDVLVSVFRAPHSYTGENSVEISCHASAYIINTILQTLINGGCRQALPGEFTQRAFMNGKMDLSQAEAVADLISSTNSATHKVAMSQLRGNFSSELAQLREKLLHLTTLMELELDFSDHEDLEFADRSELVVLTQTILNKVQSLAESFKTGKALKHGVPVAIVGKTNVGKSTLLNRLLHEDRAIVSDIHGTTRDVIEDTINIRGIDFRFIDTAGLRETSDEIERLGIERTKQKMQEAAIILYLADNLEDLQTLESSSPRNFKISESRNPESPNLIRVLNKIDLQSLPFPAISSQGILPISAKENIGIDDLETALVKAADIPEIKENDIIITSVRHYEALQKAHEALCRVEAGLHTSLPTDLLAEDLREALNYLGEITGGTISSQEVLNNVWANFCVGK